MLRTIFVLAMLAQIGAMPARAADADDGARVFKGQCGICHAAVEGKNGVGPSLFGVVGRKPGGVPGFRYSAANKADAQPWTVANLDPYLANPKAAMPGTTMLYAGLKNEAQRADLIAYLATLK